MDTIYKILENCEVKKLGERQYEFTASTADMDRDGEVIDVEGWDLKNFKKNPVIMYAHDYRGLPIGKATKIGVKDGKLVNNVEFPPEGTYEFADIVERLVNTGYLKTESVGFIPRKWEDGDGGEKTPRRTYTKQELLEISIVPVPSNPNALMNAVTEGVITTKQFELITKPEETDEYIRIPVDRGNHEGHRIRTIDISTKEGIKAIYCGECKKVMTYLFAKDKGWTMEKAKAWVKEHEKSIIVSTTTNNVNDNEIIEAHIQTDDIVIASPRAAQTSQEQIKDELDYLNTLIDRESLALGTLEKAIRLSIKIFDVLERTGLGYALTETDKNILKRISGNDMPVEDKKEILTTQDIQEAIKRVANKTEVIKC